MFQIFGNLDLFFWGQLLHICDFPILVAFLGVLTDWTLMPQLLWGRCSYSMSQFINEPTLKNSRTVSFQLSWIGTPHVWPVGAVSTLLHCNGSMQCCHVMKQIQNSICYASCIHCVTQRICCRRSWNFENSTNVDRQDIWPCHAKKVETTKKKSDTGATVNV